MVPSEPARTLEEACASVRWSVAPGRYALVGFAAAPDADDLALLLSEGPVQALREGGETTLLVREEVLDRVRSRHPDARVEQGLAWIRFEQPMGWDVVGFLALVTGRLAAGGIPLGAVCGFSRDHLFVGERHLQPSLALLSGLFPSAR